MRGHCEVALCRDLSSLKNLKFRKAESWKTSSFRGQAGPGKESGTRHCQGLGRGVWADREGLSPLKIFKLQKLTRTYAGQ